MNVFVKIMGIIGTVIVSIILLPCSPILFIVFYVKGAKQTIQKWDDKIVNINEHKGE